MVCPTCALDNDPSNAYCVRCNTVLTSAYGAPGHSGPPAYDLAGYSAPTSPPVYDPATLNPPMSPPVYDPATFNPPMGQPVYDPATFNPPTSPLAYNPGTYTPTAYPPPYGAPISGPPISPPPLSPQPSVIYPPMNPPPARSRWASGAWPFAALGIVLVIAATVLAVMKLTGGGPAGTRTDNAASNGPTVVQDTTAAAPDPPGQSGPATQPNQPGQPNQQAAHSQAVAVDELLKASIGSRRKLNSAIDRVNRCSDLNGALNDMHAVGDERQAQIASVGSFDLSALPSADQIRGTLQTALRYSLDADRSFVSWAEEAAYNGCQPSSQRTAYYNEAMRLSDLAGRSKEQFLAVWNPVAGQVGVGTRSRDDI